MTPFWRTRTLALEKACLTRNTAYGYVVLVEDASSLCTLLWSREQDSLHPTAYKAVLIHSTKRACTRGPGGPLGDFRALV